MLAFALGVIVLILLLLAAYSFSKADPKQAARVFRYIGAGTALLFAVFLLVRGLIGPAISIGLIGLGLLGYVSLWRASFGGRTQKTRVRSPVCVRRFWKWNSTTTAAPCAVGF